MYILKTGHLWSEITDIKNEINTDADAVIFLHFLDGSEIGPEYSKKGFAHACVMCRFSDLEHYGRYCEKTLDWFCVAGDVEETVSRYGIGLDVLYYPQNHGFITDFMGKLHSEFVARKKYYRDVCEVYLSEFFINLAREVNLSANVTGLDREIKESLCFLRQKLYLECHKKWSIEDMARLINFSPSYLHSSYKELFGVSPVNDLIDARIERSKILLFESEMTANEIAATVGYSNSSHFIRQFTGRVGISPQKFRRNRHDNKK